MDWNHFLGWSESEREDIRLVGFSYVNQGLYELAIPFFQALTVLEPGNSYDLQTLGALFLETGKSLEALELLDRSLEIEPNHFPTLLNRAKALHILGYQKQAMSQIEALQYCEDQEIAKQASALKLMYQ